MTAINFFYRFHPLSNIRVVAPSMTNMANLQQFSVTAVYDMTCFVAIGEFISAHLLACFMAILVLGLIGMCLVLRRCCRCGFCTECRGSGWSSTGHKGPHRQCTQPSLTLQQETVWNSVRHLSGVRRRHLAADNWACTAVDDVKSCLLFHIRWWIWAVQLFTGCTPSCLYIRTFKKKETDMLLSSYHFYDFCLNGCIIPMLVNALY